MRFFLSFLFFVYLWVPKVVGQLDFTTCSLSFSGVPVNVLCPGDCFVTSGLILPPPDSGLVGVERKLWVFCSHPNATAVQINNIPPYTISSLNSNVSMLSPHWVGIDTAFSLSICINSGASEPIKFILYAAIDDTLCHAIDSFYVQASPAPNFAGLPLLLKDPTTFTNLTSIKSGDALQFNLGTPTPADASVIWQYKDEDSTWQDIVDTNFDKFTFVVPPMNPYLTYDCENSTTGFLDRRFRAVISVLTGGVTCQYITASKLLRICCPIGQGLVNILPNIQTCEGYSMDATISLDLVPLFVDSMAEGVTIKWFLNDSLLSFDNQASFSLFMTIGSSGSCVKAIITNCNLPPITLTACLQTHLAPVCGFLYRSPDDVHLDSLSNAPYYTYQLCPGDDAVLQISEFSNCDVQWQSSFDAVSWEPYISLGTTNIEQNTNILMPSELPYIFYRVMGTPIGGANSPCEPCYSNTLKIQEKPTFDAPQITGPSTACAGSLMSFVVENPNDGVIYEWYRNGLLIGEGANFSTTALSDAYYWSEATNGCERKVSDKIFVNVCFIEGGITCPLSPNPCACVGVPIQLAFVAAASCSPANFTYNWSWNGDSSTAAVMTDTPPAEGESYTVVVTDQISGCVLSCSKFIKPCDKN